MVLEFNCWLIGRSYAPWRGEDGAVAGFLNRMHFLYRILTVACFESTGRIIADRRLRTLAELDSSLASAVTMNDLGNSISRAFTFNAYDVPFALVYFCTVEPGSVPDSTGPERRSALDTSYNTDLTLTYTLQSTVGIPKGHPLAPRVVEIRLQSGNNGHVWPFRKMAMEQIEIKMSLASESLEGIQHQGWPDHPKFAVAVPLFGAREMSGRERIKGMLIMGLNPRRPCRDDYLSWIRICSRHIAAAMTVTKSAGEAAQRTEDLALLARSRTTFFNK